MAGHVTVSKADVAAATPRSIDVTGFVKQSAAGGTRTFMVFRPLRHPAHGDIPADDIAASYAVFHSGEAATLGLRPKLTIQFR